MIKSKSWIFISQSGKVITYRYRQEEIDRFTLISNYLFHENHTNDDEYYEA